MGQLVNILLAIDQTKTVPHRTLDCRQGFDGLSQVYCQTVPLPQFGISVASSIATSLADVSIGISLLLPMIENGKHTSYRGECQTLLNKV